MRARNGAISFNDDDSSVFTTFIIGERTNNDGFASLQFNPTLNTLSSKIDATSTYTAIWTNKNSTNGQRFNINYDTADETVQLRPNAVTRLEANKYGTTITGTMNADSATIGSQVRIVPDGTDAHIYVGNGTQGLDLAWFNSAGGYVQNHSLDLHIRNYANDKDVTLETDNGAGGVTEYVLCDGSTGAVELKHYGTKKLETTVYGATVTGTVNADSASVNILNIPTGSSTGNRIQLGDDLLLFDDGNAHIHSKNSILWLNAQTGEQVRINNQYDGAVYLSRPAGEGVVIKEHYDLTSDSSQLSTLTQTAIASFSSSTYTGGKFLITAHDHVAGARQISELLVLRDSAAGTAHATEYGQIYTSGVLATYDVDINSGNIRVLATSASTNATTYQVAETLMRD